MLAYRYADRRKNNPEVGLVNEASDPEQAKTPFEVDTVSLHVHERQAWTWGFSKKA